MGAGRAPRADARGGTLHGSGCTAAAGPAGVCRVVGWCRRQGAMPGLVAAVLWRLAGCDVRGPEPQAHPPLQRTR